MENISGEVRSVKLDMEACSVCFTAGEGTGLKGVEYTGDKKLAPEISLDDGILKITQKGTGVIMSIMKPRLTVTIGKDTVVRDSIIMNETVIGDGCTLDKAIIAENAKLGDRVVLGAGEEVENETDPSIYSHGIVTIDEWSEIPDNITIGKNSMVSGITEASDYENGKLDSGKTFVKAGD